MGRLNRRNFLKGSLGSAAYVVVRPDATGAGAAPPYTVVWDLAKAYREGTPTRERVCLNGLWRWQPAAVSSRTVPSDDWGYFRVPDCWPGRNRQVTGQQLFYLHPHWEKLDLSGVTAAWYQREITVPAEWTGRRISLYAEYLNSYAVVYIDRAMVGEMRYPGGEVDLTFSCRPGQKHLLSMLVAALRLVP